MLTLAFILILIGIGIGIGFATLWLGPGAYCFYLWEAVTGQESNVAPPNGWREHLLWFFIGGYPILAGLTWCVAEIFFGVSFMA